MSFVHLHLHSEYSLIDSCIRIRPLVEAVARAGMPAVALTDHVNLFAMVKFYRAAQQAGIKPIIGAEMLIESDAEQGRADALVLLCLDREGHLNLTRLITRAYIEGQSGGQARIRREWLADASAGLIALNGPRGDIGQALLAGDADGASERLAFWLRHFPDRFYLEIQRSGRPGDERHLHAAVELALAHDVPVVAGNDVRFLAREDFEAHEARVCIHDGRTLDDPRRPRLYSEEQYLRTPEEMADLFSDIPEALENTLEIARRCTLELSLGTNVLPDFPVPEGMDVESYLRAQAAEGLERRLAVIDGLDADRRQAYADRLEHELGVICGMGFPGYFLIVADFIRWSRDNGIPVGPGRGSGAGSLVAYVLGITDLDPIAYDLLFERFLNPERVSMPDFDVDFCMEGRDRVIDYVAERYGRDRVSQIITYGSMAAKAVVRDVGRVLGHPYGFVDQIAKLIPFDLGMTLDKALEQEEQLRERYEQEDDVRALIDLARGLEGLARNAGKHAGGVVIAPSDLTDFTPLYCEQGSPEHTVTQLDKNDIEAVGLVKFDFLGLRTLTIMDRAIKTINAMADELGVEPVDLDRIPMDDEASFALLKSCRTTAVFQLESRGMKDLIKRLQPDTFEEIVALVALFRPGPLQSGMVDDFIDRKHGRARVVYPHPDLEPILKPTYGVILYQEQVMQIAQVLAGYSLGQADLLRRAMGKKKPEEMARQREVFLQGAEARGVDKALAASIFDLMEKFAGYGFNKSHSAAYALISYRTAWLKAHHPAAFMAAVLSADLDDTDKVVMLIDECHDLGLAVEPPDINSCARAFTVADAQTIRYGLGAIKGVGESALESIVREREHGGPYRDLFDLCRRIDLRRANRRVLEALIRAGALDSLDPHRARSMARLPLALQAAERHARDQASGQNDLFGLAPATLVPKPSRGSDGSRGEAIPEWEDEERLRGEKETLGLYLTGHPIERYEDELRQFVGQRIRDLRPVGDGRALVAGMIVAIRTMNSRRGERIAFVTLDDRSGRLEVAFFGEAYQAAREVLAKDRIVVVTGNLSIDDGENLRFRAERAYDIEQARGLYAKRIELDLPADRARPDLVGELAGVLRPYTPGPCPLRINYRGDGGRASLLLGEDWAARPTNELLQRLQRLAGEGRVRMVY